MAKNEVTQIYLAQQLGALSMARLPAWFSEGMATWASNGGAAGHAYEPNCWSGSGMGSMSNR